MKRIVITVLLLLSVSAYGQPYETVYPDYNPIPYTGIFELNEQIYRVGLHNIIEISSDLGNTWESRTPAVQQFNIIQVTSSEN
ncbi:hypothetical protein KQI65_08125, partial [bacterium]|nr:hypothetical protein [bacterium]